LVGIANLVAGAFCSIPLAVSSIPMAFPAINPNDGAFCQAWPYGLSQGMLTLQNLPSTAHFLVQNQLIKEPNNVESLVLVVLQF